MHNVMGWNPGRGYLERTSPYSQTDHERPLAWWNDLASFYLDRAHAHTMRCRMKIRKKKTFWIMMVILGFLSLVCGLATSPVKRGLSLASEAPFFNPPDSFRESLLVGTWYTSYMEWGEETLIIRPDGTFRQIYHNHANNGDFSFETPWNRWWVERLPDGRMYLHLMGAKYFLQGPSFADKLSNGYLIPCPQERARACDDDKVQIPFYAYDWIGGEYIPMAGELILNIRVDSSGRIILVHMWSSSDGGFPIIGGESEIFRKMSPSTGE